MGWLGQTHCTEHFKQQLGLSRALNGEPRSRRVSRRGTCCNPASGGIGTTKSWIWGAQGKCFTHQTPCDILSQHRRSSCLPRVQKLEVTLHMHRVWRKSAENSFTFYGDYLKIRITDYSWNSVSLGRTLHLWREPLQRRSRPCSNGSGLLALCLTRCRSMGELCTHIIQIIQLAHL